MPLNSLDYRPFEIKTLAGGIIRDRRWNLVPPGAWQEAFAFIVDDEIAIKAPGYESWAIDIASPEFQDWIRSGACWAVEKKPSAADVFYCQGMDPSYNVWAPLTPTDWEAWLEKDTERDALGVLLAIADTPTVGAITMGMNGNYGGRAFGVLTPADPSITPNEKMKLLLRRKAGSLPVGTVALTCPIINMHVASFTSGDPQLYAATYRDIYMVNTTTRAITDTERVTPTYSTGTATSSASSPAIVGIGTGWVTAGIVVDGLFKFDDDPVTAWTRIQTVGTELSITLHEDYKGTVHGSGSAYTIIRCFMGAVDLDTARKNRWWSMVTYNSGLPERLVLATNTFDRVLKHDGNVSNEFEDLLGLDAIDEGGNVDVEAARLVTVHSESVCLGATTEDGNFHALRVRWSDPRDAETWTPYKWRDLDGEDELQAVAHLERTGVWFSTNGIHNQTWIAAPLDFAFQRKERVLGCIAPGSVQSIPKQAIIFLGNDDFYQYDLIRPRAIGDAIRDLVFDDMNDDYIPMASSHYDEISQLYLFSYPTNDGGDLMNSRTVAFDLKRQKWLEPMEGFMAYTRFFESESIPFIDDVDVLIDEYDKFFDRREFAGTPMMLGADGYGGIHKLFTGKTADYADIDATLLTGMTNLGVEGLKRLGWITLQAYDTDGTIEIYVALSRDGRNVSQWVGPIVHSMGGPIDDFEVPITVDRTANYFAFRVRTVGGHSSRAQDLRLESLKAFFRIEGRA
jgi:hypothetical protein